MRHLRLGKLPPRHDHRLLHLAYYLTELPRTPANVDYSTRLHGPLGMMANDHLGDCTAAGAAHLVQVWTALEGREVTPSDDEVIALYDRVNGGLDQGALCTDVLRAWRRQPLGGESPYAYVAIEPGNEHHVRFGIDAFGGTYIGLALPLSAQQQLGRVWTVTSGPDGAAGSWGGHCVACCGYDQRGVLCITWGQLQWMTWEFWRRYADEAYVSIPRSWQERDERPTGFDMSALEHDLSAIDGENVVGLGIVPHG